jgi:hypothetical protein
MLIKNRWLLATWMALAALLCGPTAFAAADKDYPDTWAKPGGDAPDKDVPGWLVNLGPTGARAKVTKTSFIVRYIFKESPAAGKLNLDDEIVGVFGKPFNPNPPAPTARYGYEGPIMELGQAIEKAEGKDGKLVLNVKRGSSIEDVTIALEPIGTFSSTFPLKCKKSDLLRARALKYFVDHPEADGSCNTRSAICLALLVSEDPKHQAIAKERILRWATERPDAGTWSWPAAYQLITLAEYYLMTKDPSVLPTMKLDVAHLEEIQYRKGKNFSFDAERTEAERKNKPPLVVNGVTHEYDKLKAAIDYYDGGFGHGSPGGYGPMQYTTILSVIGWQLAERSGLTVTPERMESAFKYIHYGTNASGYLAYGSEFTFDGYTIYDPTAFMRGTGGERAVGKSGAALIAHKLAADRADSTEYVNKYKGYYKIAYAGLPNGHADGNLNLFWGFVGSGAVDDETTLRTVMDYFKPWINMSRCFDGSFVAQPNRHAGDDDAYYHSSRYNPTASMALALGIGSPKLLIQGIQVSIPGVNPKALTGKLDLAYKAIVAKSFGDTLRLVKSARSAKNFPAGDEAVCAALYEYVGKQFEKDLASLAALEKIGDFASLESSFTKLKSTYGTLDEFKDKAQRYEDGLKQDAWKAEIKLGERYAQMVATLKRSRSKTSVRDLEKFAEKNPESIYGKWAGEVAKGFISDGSISDPSSSGNAISTTKKP